MVRFFILHPNSVAGAEWAGQIWMYPASRGRTPLPVDDILPSRLVADYYSAIASYQHGIWRGAAQHARIVLEGVVKHLLAAAGNRPAKPTLAGQLKALTESTDLAKPI